MTTDDDKSLGEAATHAGAKRRPARDEVSLGDERTLGGGDAAGVDTLLEDIEIVDLETRYKVEGTLGQGGMGAVVLATDTRLGRKVAIKRILGEAARNKTAMQRFLTEAKAIAALNHPNIVQIYDYGRAKDGPFLIMEYVDGGSLADRCRQGAIPLEEAVELACQICDGLAEAHNAGIVHRDIKPANVLLNRDGLPKLTDFGLAKAEAADHGMTMTGAVMGTPDFMPPEQRRNAAEVDHRSDLWSLAATVYQMVTGRSPKIIDLRHIPDPLRDVFARALEEDKVARYQSARDLRDALVAGGNASQRHPASPSSDEAILEGRCTACGAINPDPNRKFCRRCGGALTCPCLDCGAPLPVWEDFCGGCGARQSALIDDRRTTLAAELGRAESDLAAFRFVEARAIAERHRDETHPRLADGRARAADFLVTLEAAEADATRRVTDALTAASRHEAEGDVTSAIRCLDALPAGLHFFAIPGKPTVDHALAVLRQARQAAARDARVREARLSIQRHEYDDALAHLASIEPAAVDDDVLALQASARDALARIADLSSRLWGEPPPEEGPRGDEAVLSLLDELLALRPDDARAVARRDGILAHREQLANQRREALDAAGVLIAAHRWADACELLDGLTPELRSPDVMLVREQAARCWADQSSRMREITVAVRDKRFAGLSAMTAAYLATQPDDRRVIVLHEQLLARDATDRGVTGIGRDLAAWATASALISLAIWGVGTALDSRTMPRTVMGGTAIFGFLTAVVAACLPHLVGRSIAAGGLGPALALGLGLPCLVSDVILLLAGGPAGAVFTSFLLGCAVPVGVSILRARGVIAQRHSLEAQVAEYASHPRLADAGALFQRGRFTEAIPLFRQITCERPNIHRAWIDLARCEVRCDQSDAAVDTLTRAARVYPDDALILYNRACYLVKSGDVQRFVDDLARAIAIESRYREMAGKDPDFEIVRGTDAFQAAVAEAL